ncbi:hypothetical protein BC830DRAFT_4787 [Chytriomyces sp. MP71]|nr:hypothetical protein BC830DRAFT_4787 [Chytriomyces sp. MP71]
MSWPAREPTREGAAAHGDSVVERIDDGGREAVMLGGMGGVMGDSGGSGGGGVVNSAQGEVRKAGWTGSAIGPSGGPSSLPRALGGGGGGPLREQGLHHLHHSLAAFTRNGLSPSLAPAVASSLGRSLSPNLSMRLLSSPRMNRSGALGSSVRSRNASFVGSFGLDRENIMAMALYARSPLLASSPSRDLEHFAGLTDSFCKDFVCCGINMDNLHDLLQHFEEYHAALNDDIDSDSDVDDTDIVDSRQQPSTMWNSYGRSRSFSDSKSGIVEEYSDPSHLLPFEFDSPSTLAGPSGSTSGINIVMQTSSASSTNFSYPGKPGSVPNSLSFVSRGRSFLSADVGGGASSSAFSANAGAANTITSLSNSTSTQPLQFNTTGFDSTMDSSCNSGGNVNSSASISNILSTSLGALSMAGPTSTSSNISNTVNPLFMRGSSSPTFSFGAAATASDVKAGGSSVSGNGIPSPSNSTKSSTPPPLHHEVGGFFSSNPAISAGNTIEPASLITRSIGTSAITPSASSVGMAKIESGSLQRQQQQPQASSAVMNGRTVLKGEVSITSPALEPTSTTMNDGETIVQATTTVTAMASAPPVPQHLQRLNDALAGAVAAASLVHDDLQIRKRKFVPMATADAMDVDGSSVGVNHSGSGMSLIGSMTDSTFIALKKRLFSDEEAAIVEGVVSRMEGVIGETSDMGGLSVLVSTATTAANSPTVPHMSLQLQTRETQLVQDPLQSQQLAEQEHDKQQPSIAATILAAHFKKRTPMSSASFSPVETDAALSNQQQVAKFTELSAEAIEAFQAMTAQQQQDFIVNHLDPNQIALLMMLVNQATLSADPVAADSPATSSTESTSGSGNQALAATPVSAPSTPSVTSIASSTSSSKPGAKGSKGAAKDAAAKGFVGGKLLLKPGRGRNGPKTKVTQKQTLKQLKEQHMMHLQQQGLLTGQDGTPTDSDSTPSTTQQPSEEGEVVDDDRPFKCHLCEKTYKNPGGIKYHLKHTHGIEHVSFSDMTEADRPYLCTVEGCGKRYKNLNGLKYHIEHAHVAILEGTASSVTGP